MDEISEKKWFIYVRDQHEGPFSIFEIQSQLQTGRLTQETFVWKEGMADWTLMREVPEFFLIPPVSAAVPVDTAVTPEFVVSMQIDSEESMETASAATEFAPSLLLGSSSIEVVPVSSFHAHEVSHEAQAEQMSPQAQNDPTQDTELPVATKRFWRTSLLLLGLVLIGMVGSYVVVRQPTAFLSLVSTQTLSGAGAEERLRASLILLARRFPSQLNWLNHWVSPLPLLSDVDSNEFLELKRIAQLSRETGVQVSFAIVSSGMGDPASPMFYVVSNVDDVLPLHLYLIGNSETLLNQTHFFLDVEVQLEQRMAKTAPIRAHDGHPIPRGEYTVYVTAKENQKGLPQFVTETSLPEPLPGELARDLKILAVRKVFLGGAKDATYTSRLKDYHDKLQVKSLAEIAEVNQFAATLESQVNSTETKFNLLKRGSKLALSKKQWDLFHIAWSKLQAELGREFQKWTPDGLAQNVYHGVLYQLLQQAESAAAKLHALHHAFFLGVQDVKTFEIQLGASLAEARSSLALLRTKIDQIEKLGITPNGMPRREDSGTH